MKKLIFALFCAVVLFTSCSKDSYYEPFVVTGIESVSNSMSTYYEKGQDKYSMEDIAIAPTGKYQIGDTIPEASMRFR